MLLRVFGPQTFELVWPKSKNDYLCIREDAMLPAENNHNPPAVETPEPTVAPAPTPQRQPNGKFIASPGGPKRKRSGKKLPRKGEPPEAIDSASGKKLPATLQTATTVEQLTALLAQHQRIVQACEVLLAALNVSDARRS